MKRLLLPVLATLTALALVPLGGSSASASDNSPIGPGVQMVVHMGNGEAQCTGNFVFSTTTKARKRVLVTARRATRHHKARKRHFRMKVTTTRHTYVGMAAHCLGTGSDTDTNGCTSGSLKLGTPVAFMDGLTQSKAGTQVGTGVVRYSSWLAMQKAHYTDSSQPDACAYNDLALVEVNRAYLPKVSPTVPFIGGPVSLGSALPPAGSSIYTVGNSSRRGTERATSGTVKDSEGWTMTVRTASPGVPGDSGSGYLDASGRAVGVLSTIDLFPDTGANGVGSLPREVAFARSHGMGGLALVHGGPFTPQNAGQSTGSPSGSLLDLSSALGVLGL